MAKKKATWQELLDGVLDGFDNAITSKAGEQDDPSDRHHVQRRLSVLLKGCGRRSRSDEFDKAVQHGLEERHLFMHPILEGRLPSDSWLRITRDPVPEHRHLFAKEQHFQEFLECAKNVDVIDALADLELVQGQFPFASGRRADLLYFDRRADEYVVVELKHEDAGDGAASQLVSYMIQVQEQLADRQGRKVRGILIVGSVSRDQIATFETLASQYTIQLLTYQLNIQVDTLFPRPEPNALASHKTPVDSQGSVAHVVSA
jgi:hypothetical protein